MNNVSPYWCADPRLSAAGSPRRRESLLGVSEADPAVIAGGPEALLPLPTPIAYGAERQRLAALFQLPLPYLPEDMLRRGLHETVGDWRVRMTIALDMLGAIGFDDDGMPRYGRWTACPKPRTSSPPPAASTAATRPSTTRRATVSARRSAASGRTAIRWTTCWPTPASSTSTACAARSSCPPRPP